VALALGALALPLMAVLRIGTSTIVDYQLFAAGAIATNVLIGWRATRLIRVVNLQRAQLSETARTDSLTGLPNRRSWDYELQRMQSRIQKSGARLTVALLDLDQFKAYNDTHGHQAGDRLLAQSAQAWRDAMPADGYIARYGGEEFAVILPDTTANAAQQILERLRQATPAPATVSIGHAEYRAGANLTDIFADADAALYAAKSRGRNLVVGISVKKPEPPALMRIVG
jgi:diguanylate cyclase (GGDEF)-like protein